MSKTDFKKTLKHLYVPSSKEVIIVDVPKMKFLMIDGQGDPNNSQEFQDALSALYGITFTLKFSFKKEEKPGGYFEHVAPPLEGLWWVNDMREFSLKRKDEWKWTLMIMQPDFITEYMVKNAGNELKEKKDSPAISITRLEDFQEDLSAQIMHIGPYSAEGPTVEKIHRFIRENGYELRGKHHEIYLGDPRRTAPEKLKTVIRQPVK